MLELWKRERKVTGLLMLMNVTWDMCTELSEILNHNEEPTQQFVAITYMYIYIYIVG